MATPEVDSVQLVTPRVDALTRSLREFMFRAGIPGRTYDPESEVGPLSRPGGRSGLGHR